MSSRYALVSNAAGEIYALDSGPWYEWMPGRLHTYDRRVGLATTRLDVDALLTYFQEGWSLGPQPTWALAVGSAIWSFLEKNRDARVVSDDDQIWDQPSDPDADMPVFKACGSRRDHDRLIVRERQP